jgi:cytoskeletal protein CcmA (bactofilin family)
MHDAAEARDCAHAGIELACLWIAQDPNWRVNRSLGAWATDLPIGQGTVTIEVSEPIDGNLANRSYDAVRVRSTGRREQARQTWEVTLNADPDPLPVLQYGLHTRGRLRIDSGHSLTVRNAPLDTDNSLRNDGTIIGAVEAAGVETAGNIVGSLTIDTTTEQYPVNPFTMYVALGTEITPGSTIDRRVLSPGSNPWGAANPDGVYVIRANDDLTIRNSRINGTLVILCSSGKRVTFDNSLLIHPYRTDYPALLIQGDAEFVFSSSLGLAEATSLANFNPSGSPYQGNSDSDILDIYPSEIRGLVHVRGEARFDGNGKVRGAVVCESSSVEVRFEGSNEIIYDRSIAELPPQGYASRVPMLPQPGSWKRVVE